MTGTFQHDEQTGDDNAHTQPYTQLQLQPTAAPEGTGGNTLELNDNVIAEILAATRAMPSWNACMMEGMSWDGTADENTQKYISNIGVEES